MDTFYVESNQIMTMVFFGTTDDLLFIIAKLVNVAKVL